MKYLLSQNVSQGRKYSICHHVMCSSNSVASVAVEQQRTVDSSKVEEHDQQHEEVIEESKQPQHVFRKNVDGAQDINCTQGYHHDHPRPEDKWEGPLGIQ
jgi:hypothetical protein